MDDKIKSLVDENAFNELKEIRSQLTSIGNHPALSILVRKSIVEIRLKQQVDNMGGLPLSVSFWGEIKEMVDYILEGK